MTRQELWEKISGERKLHETYRRLFDSPDGQIVLKHLCRVAKVTSSSFVAGDPHHTSFNEGQRRLVLSILKYINKDPEVMLKQIQQGLTDENIT